MSSSSSDRSLAMDTYLVSRSKSYQPTPFPSGTLPVKCLEEVVNDDQGGNAHQDPRLNDGDEDNGAQKVHQAHSHLDDRCGNHEIHVPHILHSVEDGRKDGMRRLDEERGPVRAWKTRPGHHCSLISTRHPRSDGALSGSCSHAKAAQRSLEGAYPASSSLCPSRFRAHSPWRTC